MTIKPSSIRDSVNPILHTSQGYTCEYDFQLNKPVADRTTLETLRHVVKQRARDQNRQNKIRPRMEGGFRQSGCRASRELRRAM